MANLQNKKTVEESVMTPDVFKKTFLRSFPLQACFCYERMQNVGFAYQMIPALKKLYKDKQEISEALKRHLAIFNTTPTIVTFITGAAIALEEKFKREKDAGEECDEESINAVKTALMGPLAGIGDSFFWGTFRIIGAGIGATLAAKGSIIGAILFLLIYNIPHLLLRYHGLKIGYASGVSFLSNISEGGVIGKLTEVAKILGLIVVGSMAASMVKLATPAVINIGGAKIVVQQIFDGILKGILPLGLTFAIYKLLQKGIKTTTILWGMIVISILGSVLGIL
jgi:PTS system mannose-specific IID component/fructoselysine and glucoselysine-specific PTS system IID component